ncbi:MAG: hypothetical protein JKY37_06815, partial [Nannocystaceae bacterium]|nr:hypothetical protein [Nannocystaceae bacterium]
MRRFPARHVLALFTVASLTGAVGCTLKKCEDGKCGRAKKEKEEPEPATEAPRTRADFGPGFAVVKEALLADVKNCFLPDPSLCLDDDALFAEVFAKVLGQAGVEKRVGAQLPTDGKALRFFLQRASMSYRLAQKATQQRRDAVEALIEARYAAPKIEQKGARV